MRFEHRFIAVSISRMGTIATFSREST
ncbi:hypothetical protein VCHENC02_0285A, partial [Vibrio harveyi]